MRMSHQLGRGRTPIGRRLLVGAAMVSCAAVGAILAPTADAAQPAPPQGWKTVFNDDFAAASGAGVDPANWLHDLGTGYPGGAASWGTGEVETMTADRTNVFQDGAGNLAIKPVRDSTGNWTSGRIETQRTDFQPPPGGALRVEARIQLPNVTGAGAQGYWPAFWMLGAPFRGNHTNWPLVGEIDILENVNGTDTAVGTLHCGVNPGGPCNETTGIAGRTACPGGPCQASFHTYRIEWDRSVTPEAIRWYVDDVQYHSVSAAQVDPAAWAQATNHGYFIILNVAVGGGFPGAPTPTTTPDVPMLIDYVAAYQR